MSMMSTRVFSLAAPVVAPVVVMIVALGLPLGLALPSPHGASESASPVIVRIDTGSLSGLLLPSGMAVFKGVPYAQPPVGRLRWREPQPPLPWNGVRDATHYSAACLQNPLGTAGFLAPLAKLYGAQYPASKFEMSEDCLYLNIWVPQWPSPAPQPTSRQLKTRIPVMVPIPVMVWIHGGSNRVGSASETAYDGAALARKGVVVVTVNYRLGPLGFFAHPELTRESPHHASGNYGLLDQITALEWVRRNIAEFGGDPARVTVFGESAGSIDAGLLLCSPLASGLFQRVIMESGPVLALAPTLSPRERGERFGEQVTASLGFAGSSPGTSTLDRLRALPAERVMQTINDVAKREGDAGTLMDGWCLREHPAALFAQAKVPAVTMMIGNNGREMSAFRAASSASNPAPGTGDALMNMIRIFYGGSASVVAALYLVDTKLGRIKAADGWLNDVIGTCPGMAMAAVHASFGHRAYFYQFLRAVPGKGKDALGSFHSLELPYVFGAFGVPEWNWLPFEPVDHELGEKIMSYWTNFAKTGNPNAPDLVGWPTFDSESQASIEFGETGSVSARSKGRPAFCDLDVQRLKGRMEQAGRKEGGGGR